MSKAAKSHIDTWPQPAANHREQARQLQQLAADALVIRDAVADFMATEHLADPAAVNLGRQSRRILTEAHHLLQAAAERMEAKQ